MFSSRFLLFALLTCHLVFASSPAEARTVYRCVRNGTVSLSTAPEPGSKCEAKQVDDDAAKVPNLWGSMGVGDRRRHEQRRRRRPYTLAIPARARGPPWNAYRSARSDSSARSSSAVK